MTPSRAKTLRRAALVGAVLAAVALAWRPVRASIFGEENATLVQQLVQLIKIHGELEVVSDGVQEGAAAARDLYEIYDQAQAAVDEMKHYSTEQFLRDLRADVYDQYPGFELLADYAQGDTVSQWRRSRADSPFTTYEMIGAVFGDLTGPLKDKAAAGDIPMQRAAIQRFEAAGAFATASAAEAWTESADQDAKALYEMAADAYGEPAQHVSARALALMAVQQSHIIRLLARDVRLEGVRGAMQWAERVESLNQREQMKGEVSESLQDAVKPPEMMRFDRPILE